LNAYALLNSMVADPATYDLTNVTEACVTPNIAPFECARPDEYLFWDGIHPTRAVHTIVATAAALLLHP
jgi:phospholipase/lecithinase/hemolysin